MKIRKNLLLTLIVIFIIGVTIIFSQSPTPNNQNKKIDLFSDGPDTPSATPEIDVSNITIEWGDPEQVIKPDASKIKGINKRKMMKIKKSDQSDVEIYRNQIQLGEPIEWPEVRTELILSESQLTDTTEDK